MTTHVLGALRAKRLEIAAHVHDTEAKLTKLRAALANLDAAMAILRAGHPDGVPERRIGADAARRVIEKALDDGQGDPKRNKP